MYFATSQEYTSLSHTHTLSLPIPIPIAIIFIFIMNPSTTKPQHPLPPSLLPYFPPAAAATSSPNGNTSGTGPTGVIPNGLIC